MREEKHFLEKNKEINQNEKGEYIGTAFLTYYKEDDAKKCFDENKDKKILEWDIEVQYRKNTNHYIHNNNYHNMLKIIIEIIIIEIWKLI